MRDPNSDGGGRWVNLKLYDPGGLSHLKKLTTGRHRTDFLFGNLTGTDLALYSFNADGKKILYQHITTTDFWHIITEVGAIWLIQDHTGKDFAVFRAEKEVGRVLVIPTPHLITLGLSKVSGDNQAGVSDAVLANPFVVEVREENLSVLEGIVVTFTVTAGAGTLSVTHTTTDKNGRAESALTLGPNQGTNTVSVSAAGIEGTVTFNAVAEAAVNIPDSNFRSKIESALGKAEGDPITPSEMARLTHLDAPNANISDLTGLKFATNLTELYLWDNNISDISAVAGLTHLTGLHLGGNSVSDISPVAGLTNLTSLHLPGNNISDISLVAGLVNLTYLNLNGTNISDISPVVGLTHLIQLYLGWNNITDLSPLRELTDLTLLWLQHNNISDLDPVVRNKGLERGDEVYVQGNPLSYQSINTHIPILEDRRVTVKFDNRPHAALLKISGDNQNGASLVRLSQPFVVEAQGANGSPIAGGFGEVCCYRGWWHTQHDNHKD